jgi:hypothetical protein
MKRFSIYSKLVLAFVIFLGFAYFIKGKGLNDFIITILSVSSFIFGIILAFSVSGRNSRLTGIKEKLREQDAILLNVYMLSKELGREITTKIRERIDAILITQIDYELIDFDKSLKEVEKLYSFVEKIKAKKKSQELIIKKMFGDMENLLKINKEVSYQADDKMMGYEWASLLILGAVILFCLFYINTTALSLWIVSILSTAIVLLLFVLEEIDSLVWQEKDWIWQPLSKLFLDLGLIPYFPVDLFDEKRIDLRKLYELKKIRVATYPKPYPDMSRKKVVVKTFK